MPDAGAVEGADWASFGRDPGGSQHSPLDQINLKNVKQLRRVWTHRSGDFIDASYPKGTVLQTIALHANGTLYICTPFGRVFALDPATGRERWVFDPHKPDPKTGRAAFSPPLAMPSRCRGVAYWAPSAAEGAAANDATHGAPCRKRIFKNGDAARVYAIDADTGQACADFGASKGHPGYVTHNDFENYGDGFAGSATAPPAIINDLVISAMSVNDGLSNAKDGIVRAFDVHSGELRWEFNPIPADQRNLSGAANVWSTISVDPLRNLVFLPTTSPSTDYYGGGRRFDIPLANSIVALDGASGKVVWSKQVVHQPTCPVTSRRKRSRCRPTWPPSPIKHSRATRCSVSRRSIVMPVSESSMPCVTTACTRRLRYAVRSSSRRRSAAATGVVPRTTPPAIF
ncbi:MAG: hypothetical protein EBR15_08210 [Gammaproteobacteria bacterium]|nr:hypothetical protein [Gammaproteobacteria bacterium]